MSALRQRSPIELCIAAVQLVQKKPRTRAELAHLVGCHLNQASNYLHAMLAEGLVTRTKPDWRGSRGGSPDIWSWAPVESIDKEEKDAA